jgi:hypothetical protein
MITEAHLASIDKLLKQCLDNDEKLSEWEYEFVCDMAQKVEHYGTDMRISDKQQEIFDRLDHKVNS